LPVSLLVFQVLVFLLLGHLSIFFGGDEFGSKFSHLVHFELACGGVSFVVLDRGGLVLFEVVLAVGLLEEVVYLVEGVNCHFCDC